MPVLTFRGIQEEELKQISTPMLDDLSQIMNCDRSILHLHLLHTTAIPDGKTVKGSPFVEITMFDRGQEIHDQAAKCVCDHVQSLGYEKVGLWITLRPKNIYYTNGQHH